MKRIIELLAHHKSLRFPDHPEDDILDELLLELAEYDGFLVGLAERVAAGDKGAWRGSSDGEALLEKIQRRMDEIAIQDPQRTDITSFMDSMKALGASLADNAGGGPLGGRTGVLRAAGGGAGAEGAQARGKLT